MALDANVSAGVGAWSGHPFNKNKEKKTTNKTT